MKQTKWDLFKSLINQTQIGEVIYRQDLLRAQEAAVCQGSIDNNEHWTFDSYRNIAMRAGYLAPELKHGVYRVVRHFSDDLSTSSLLAEYYKKNKFN